MYKPVRLDAQGRVVRRLGGVEQRLGGVERLGRAERRLGRAAEAVELCGAAELLGVPLTVCMYKPVQLDAQGRAVRWLGGVEAWQSGAAWQGRVEAWQSGRGSGALWSGRAFGCSPYNM